ADPAADESRQQMARVQFRGLPSWPLQLFSGAVSNADHLKALPNSVPELGVDDREFQLLFDKQAAARAQAFEGATREPPVGLVSEVVEVQLIDQALDRDLELRHLVAGLDAVGHRNELDAVALQPTVELERLHEIARQA